MLTSVAIALSLLLIAASVIIHYEFLRVTSEFATRADIPRRAHILVVQIDGELEGGVLDYLSITTFTTLGIGDIHPRGSLRIIAGVESLNGIVLIGWSAPFTYLSTEQFWEDKPRSVQRLSG